MIDRIARARPHPGTVAPAHRMRPGQIALAAFTMLALGVRVFEAPGDPLVFGRMAACAVAVVFVWCAPLRSLAVRASLVLVLEAGIGCASFAAVDAPFVLAHRVQIGQFAVSLSDRVGRMERDLRARYSIGRVRTTGAPIALATVAGRVPAAPRVEARSFATPRAIARAGDSPEAAAGPTRCGRIAVEGARSPLRRAGTARQVVDDIGALRSAVRDARRDVPAAAIRATAVKIT